MSVANGDRQTSEEMGSEKWSYTLFWITKGVREENLHMSNLNVNIELVY